MPDSTPKKPKKKVAKKKAALVSQRRMSRSRPWVALTLATLSLLLFVAIWDFELEQSSQISTEPTRNLVGGLGAGASFWAFYLFGVSTWLIPPYLLWLSVRFIIKQLPKRRIQVVIASLISLVCASGLSAMLGSGSSVADSVFAHQVPEGFGFGGLIGSKSSSVLLEPFVGPFGAFVLLLIGFVLCSILVFTDDFSKITEWLRKKLTTKYQNFAEGFAERRKEKQAFAATLREEKEAARKAKIEAKRARQLEKAQAKEQPIDEEDELEEAPDETEPKASLLSQISARKAAKPKEPKVSSPSPEPLPVKAEPELIDDVKEEAVEPEKPTLQSAIKIVAGEKTEKAVDSIPDRRGDYVFPPLELLAEAPDDTDFSNEDHAGTMEALVRTLDEFGVKVIPGEIHTGPVITRYEVTPAPGVRVEKIVNLDKNIALGLRAMSVRILAPVPGKGTVGIEVPNKAPQAVCMRDIVESRSWADAKAEIPVVLGKDVTGKPMVADLTKMPHVLIAGSTGSGKTVCINAIIASLLYHSGPEDLRFIMVDPKVVEMQMYNALPHMLIPVVTEPKKVPGALKWLIAEMDRRYQIFASENVRNIAGFNAKIAKNKEEQAKAEAMDLEMSPEERAAVSQIEVPRDDDAFEIPKKKLPYIVCVIDELADLMMVAPADIETCIARIAQLARAAGIHLILATQRPSVNVITGVIKANLPSRISFKVASKVDSRTILDGGGAEALIGRGDMLFIPPGTSNIVRAQGAFVSDDEINAIVDYLKEKNDPPVFAEEVQRQIDAGGDEEGSGGSGGADEGEDELFGAALDVLRSTKRASTSMLQRRLRIGYNRAARLMEELEDRGVVGPENGSSPREILVDLDAM